MSETIYLRISTQNIACLHRQVHTGIYHSVTYYTGPEGAREKRPSENESYSIRKEPVG